MKQWIRFGTYVQFSVFKKPPSKTKKINTFKMFIIINFYDGHGKFWYYNVKLIRLNISYWYLLVITNIAISDSTQIYFDVCSDQRTKTLLYEPI